MACGFEYFDPKFVMFVAVCLEAAETVLASTFTRHDITQTRHLNCDIKPPTLMTHIP